MVLYHTYLRFDDSNHSNKEIISTTTQSSKNKEGNLILIIFSLNTSEYISVCSNDLVDFLGDGYCDDEANTEACLYDMGDCCDFNSISQSLCIECFCYGDLPPITWCTNEIIIAVHNEWKNNLGDGQCDPELNNENYFFDAGDCCFDPEEIHQCIESNVFCDSDTLGDGKCQDYNNGPKCDYDLGDCCGIDVGPGQNGTQCCFCKCHESNESLDYWMDYGLVIGI